MLSTTSEKEKRVCLTYGKRDLEMPIVKMAEEATEVRQAVDVETRKTCNLLAGED